MYITSLKTENFRSLPNCSINFDKGLTVITGKNGSGKTNIIDALKFALDGNSISKDNLLTFGSKKGYIKLWLTDGIDFDKYSVYKQFDESGVETLNNFKIPYESVNCDILDADSHCYFNSDEMKKYAQILKEYSENTQIIIASLSPEIINIADMVIELENKDNQTYIKDTCPV